MGVGLNSSNLLHAFCIILTSAWAHKGHAKRSFNTIQNPKLSNEKQRVPHEIPVQKH